MQNFYEYQKYRPLLRDQCARFKKEKTGWTLQRIAEKGRVQAPYLTNVLKEKAHLSPDQLFNLALVFEWDEEETEYSSLLLDHERSSLPARKQALKTRIDQVRKKKLQSHAHLKVEVLDTRSEEHTRFFLNPFYTLIVSFLGIGRYAKNPKLLAKALHLDLRQVREWLKDLTEMKFIAQGPAGYEKLKRSFHLPKESPVCGPHLNLLQQLATQQLQRLPEDQKYSFSVTFTADPATREKVQREFLHFLKTIEPMVKEAPAEELYGMRFDLFQWSHEPGAES